MENIKHIFVYGTLRRGQRAHRIFGLDTSTKYISTTAFEGAVMYDMNMYPAIVLVPDGVDKSEYSIVGDVLEILDKDLIERLDSYEGYDPHYLDRCLYHRVIIEVMGIPCWTYVYARGNNLSRQPVIKGGDWLERIKEEV